MSYWRPWRHVASLPVQWFPQQSPVQNPNQQRDYPQEYHHNPRDYRQKPRDYQQDYRQEPRDHHQNQRVHPEEYRNGSGNLLCLYKVFIGILIIAVIVCFAVFVPLLVKSLQNAKENENCYAASYGMQVTLNKTFDKNLETSLSPEFNGLAADFCTSLEENLEELDECGDEPEVCQVESFKKGSTIVIFRIRSRRRGKPTKVQPSWLTWIQGKVAASIQIGSKTGNILNLFVRFTTSSLKVIVANVGPLVECPTVQVPKGGVVVNGNIVGNPVNDSVTVQCITGHNFPGKTKTITITCLTTGEWDQVIPSCEPDVCPDIEDTWIENSEVLHGNLTGNQFGDVFVTKCDEGFTYDPNNPYDTVRTAFCEAGCQWDVNMTLACQNFDECASDPCMNEGNCTDEINQFNCTCPQGFIGDNCETDIDECASDPCLNGGNCTNGFGEFNCTCPDGFSGSQCEEDFDECTSDPCVNGNCTDALNEYSCTCFDGFFGDHCEIGCVDNCLLCDEDINGTVTCLDQQCKAGYILAKPDFTCTDCPAGCEECTHSTETSTATCVEGGCQDGYVQADDQTCHVCPNCDSCTWNTDKAVCGTCSPGYVANAESTCIACPTGCATCAQDGVCQDAGCKDGYAEVTAAFPCVSCPEGCKTCSYSANKIECDACSDGYAKAGGICIKCPAGCTLCDSNPVTDTIACTECSDRFTLDSEASQCVACAANCNKCSVAGECDPPAPSNCDEGFGFDAQSKSCGACAPYCKTCSELGKCNNGSCFTGYIYDTEAEICKACASPDQCLSCTMPDKCDSCSSGFTVNDDNTECVASAACPENCRYCTEVASQTVCRWGGCEAGYTMKKDRTCVACPTGCASCLMDATETTAECEEGKCMLGYVQDDSNVCHQCPENCLYCVLDGSDTKCKDTGCLAGQFQSPDGTCAACGDNCDTCAAAGECDSENGCNTGYFFDGETTTCADCPQDCHTCTSATECESDGCESDYYFDTDTTQCDGCSSDCLKCSETAQAGKCDPDGCTQNVYVADSGDCSGGNCAMDCWECSAPGKCNPDGCDAKAYVANSEDCSGGACAPNCDTCTTAGECNPDGCKVGYTFDATDKNCDACADDCDSCDASGPNDCDPDGCEEEHAYDAGTKSCKKYFCEDGYYLQDDFVTCIDPPAGCLAGVLTSVDGSGTEVECPEGFEYPASTGCPTGCENCDSDGNCLFSGCKEGFILKESDGTCTACPNDCKSCSSGTDGIICDVCMDSFVKIDGPACVECHDGCASCTYDTTLNEITCDADSCEPGHVDTGDSICFPCGKNCKECTYDAQKSGTTCNADQCDDNYVLDPDSLCKACPYGCAECTYDVETDSVICSQCKSDFAMNPDPSSGPCDVCPTGCASCNYDESVPPNLVCLKDGCKSGYYQNDDLTCTKCTDPNCERCDSELKCFDQQCEEGFQITEDGLCE